MKWLPFSLFQSRQIPLQSFSVALFKAKPRNDVRDSSGNDLCERIKSRKWINLICGCEEGGSRLLRGDRATNHQKVNFSSENCWSVIVSFRSSEPFFSSIILPLKSHFSSILNSTEHNDEKKYWGNCILCSIWMDTNPIYTSGGEKKISLRLESIEIGFYWAWERENIMLLKGIRRLCGAFFMSQAKGFKYSFQFWSEVVLHTYFTSSKTFKVSWLNALCWVMSVWLTTWHHFESFLNTLWYLQCKSDTLNALKGLSRT